MPGTGSRPIAMATKSPAAGGLGSERRDGAQLPDADRELAFAVHWRRGH